jgi:hypothetical protein
MLTLRRLRVNFVRRWDASTKLPRRGALSNLAQRSNTAFWLTGWTNKRETARRHGPEA